MTLFLGAVATNPIVGGSLVSGSAHDETPRGGPPREAIPTTAQPMAHRRATAKDTRDGPRPTGRSLGIPPEGGRVTEVPDRPKAVHRPRAAANSPKRGRAAALGLQFPHVQ